NGVCDIVEFTKDANGISLFGKKEKYRISPIEYKCGEPKENDCDVLQLVAQAMCLEEMLCCTIDEGSLYYGKTRHRLRIPLREELREQVRSVFAEMHGFYERRYTPKVKTTKSCSACSLKDICLPKLCRNLSVKEYIQKNLSEEKCT
ncbi:MAG: CRISPR-associated protein Cas4, partial [Oscillospiraceae bacterium]